MVLVPYSRFVKSQSSTGPHQHYWWSFSGYGISRYPTIVLAAGIVVLQICWDFTVWLFLPAGMMATTAG
jgi:hypothetical protein